MELSRSHGGPGDAAPATDDLVGRESEWTRLCAVADHDSAAGNVLVVTGEAGIGKSALLTSVEQRVLAMGQRVLRCTGSEFEGDIGYSALNQLLLPVAADVQRLPAADRDALGVAMGIATGPPPGELAVVSALRLLFDTLVRQRPLTVIVDDMQWVDRLTATVLGLLARRLDGTAFAVIAAQRVGEAGYFSSAGLPELTLGPLDRDASKILLAQRFPDITDQTLAQTLAQAQGNPLALLVLPHVVPGSGAVAGQWPELPLSRRLTETFAARIARLPTDTVSILLLVALDGTGGATALNAGGDRLAALDAAEQAGIAVIDSGARRVGFAHPLMGLAVVELSTAKQRRHAHRDLATASTDVVRRAWHLFHAALGPDEDTAAALESAARAAVQRADVAGAVTLMTHAAELTTQVGPKTRRLMSAAQLAGEIAGQLDAASALIESGRTMSPAAVGSLPEAVAAALMLMNSGGPLDTARSLIDEAVDTYVEDTEFRPDNHDLVEALNVLCVLAWAGGDEAAWRSFDRFAARLGPSIPELLAVSQGLLRDPARTAPQYLPRLQTLISHLTYHHDPLATVRVAKAAVYADRIDACRDALWRVVHDGRSGGAVASALSAVTSLCVDGWLAGSWDEVGRLATEMAEVSDTHGYRRYRWIVVDYLDALVGVARGRDDASFQRAVETAEWATARGSGIARPFLHHLMALKALGHSRFDRAYAHLSAVITPDDLPAGKPHLLWLLLDFTEAAHRCGEHAAAATLVETIAESAIADISPRLAMTAAACAALTAGQSADELFERALATEGAQRFRFEYARVQLLFGEHLRRSKSMSRARDQLQAAAQTFTTLGAAPWIARATAELDATGRRRRRSAALAGRDVLTPQEREIAMLAASGLSNKEIGQRLVLSPRTVGVHLYRAFPKLGITSRAALRDALASEPQS
ncbi:AAA family ATPase [Mycobacteroides abscessus]|uniref:AAA family ATPase n=1 Tax=Mycobacteroides abscessus TaxID=36809 RepID=UPI0018789331